MSLCQYVPLILLYFVTLLPLMLLKSTHFALAYAYQHGNIRHLFSNWDLHIPMKLSKLDGIVTALCWSSHQFKRTCLPSVAFREL